MSSMYNQIAIEHNAQVIRNYGPRRFRIYHDDNSILLYGANNLKHLAMLLSVEINMNYIRPIKKIIELLQCEMRFTRY
jgi:hypothetical protein